MIKYTSSNQLSLFKTPFDQQLDSSNRWVQLSNILPWDQLAKIYIKKLRADFGAPGIDARMVIGALIIKHKLTLGDRETIEMKGKYVYECALLYWELQYADMAYSIFEKTNRKKRAYC